MLWFLFSMFAILLVESAIFNWVGRSFGLWPTVFCVIITAIVGGALIRQQGVVAIFRLQDKVKAGQFPAQELLEGLWICVGGLLLILPGFFSDFLGLLLVIKFSRERLSIKIVQWALQKKTFNTDQYSDTANIIDGEFHEIEDSKKKG